MPATVLATFESQPRLASQLRPNVADWPVRLVETRTLADLRGAFSHAVASNTLVAIDGDMDPQTIEAVIGECQREGAGMLLFVKEMHCTATVVANAAGAVDVVVWPSDTAVLCRCIKSAVTARQRQFAIASGCPAERER